MTYEAVNPSASMRSPNSVNLERTVSLSASSSVDLTWYAYLWDGIKSMGGVKFKMAAIPYY